MLTQAPQSLPYVSDARRAAPHSYRPGYWRRLLPLLALLACATRVPSFAQPLWNPDEGYLAVQARLLAQGGTLYETVVDRKPPFVPWLYEAVFALFGSQSLTPVKWCAVAAQLVTAVLLASTARRRWGDGAGRTAGVLYLLISVGLNPEDAQAATFEVFMLPWTAAAVWCADRRRWGWCGAAVAGAFLTKQTGAAVLLPVAWTLWRCGAPRAGAVRCAVGVTAPVLAAAWATDPAGFLFWTVTGSGAYASFTGSELHVLVRGLVNAAILGVACAGILPPVVRVLRIARTGHGDLWLWLASSGAAVLAGFHFFGHYYLQLTPPLALLATAALQPLPRERLSRSLLVSACCCALFIAWGLLAPRPDLTHAERVADAVRARTAPHDPVLIWGMHPETYWLADRPPATRFLTAGLLTNYSGGRDGGRVGERWAVPGTWRTFRAEFAARPPGLVVDDSRGGPYGVGRVGALGRMLVGYERVGDVDGAVLYRPRESALLKS
ncbi:MULTISPECIES: glycosyltransferase family 39 protein [unclassified Streptomyces]|uniref:glycosyltransferase family 39 protein n=1 Tax=unclassified Streptomyces TaxID=2593676 RepID=UPI000DBA86D9|nr:MULTISPECIES: glycosyltransferase family 39 protein [unclassified Streptomyces]MYT73993.1 glycosyltransferase family 39 protein [Streptomyces sp. SID8367]RAJ89409.1 dolichyl-phosphate-mannose-protein mannosyltransferase [Streptomyces sp. PsTaAH-137]